MAVGDGAVILVDTSVLNDVLPDFFIGAHAAVRGMPILTRVVARYRTYFPTVALISPQGL